MNETPAITDLLDDPATIQADMQAVQDFAAKGTPIDPAIRARVLAPTVSGRKPSSGTDTSTLKSCGLLPPMTNEVRS